MTRGNALIKRLFIISFVALSMGLGTAQAGSAGHAKIMSDLLKAAPAINPQVLDLALRAKAHAAKTHGDDHRLTVIDYSLPSTEKRLWTFDLNKRKLLFKERVAHGKNTGGLKATKFSNVNNSKQTSLGLFRTADTYYGGNGYSLRLEGLDKGFNDLAMKRYIVMHGAWYVSDDMVKKHGRIGRSWGCPAVSDAVARKLIDTVKGGSYVFSYAEDSDWLNGSPILAKVRTGSATIAAAP